MNWITAYRRAGACLAFAFTFSLPASAFTSGCPNPDAETRKAFETCEGLGLCKLRDVALMACDQLRNWADKFKAEPRDMGDPNQPQDSVDAMSLQQRAGFVRGCVARRGGNAENVEWCKDLYRTTEEKQAVQRDKDAALVRQYDMRKSTEREELRRKGRDLGVKAGLAVSRMQRECSQPGYKATYTPSCSGAAEEVIQNADAIAEFNIAAAKLGDVPPIPEQSQLAQARAIDATFRAEEQLGQPASVTAAASGPAQTGAPLVVDPNCPVTTYTPGTNISTTTITDRHASDPRCGGAGNGRRIEGSSAMDSTREPALLRRGSSSAGAAMQGAIDRSRDPQARAEFERAERDRQASDAQALRQAATTPALGGLAAVGAAAAGMRGNDVLARQMLDLADRANAPARSPAPLPSMPSGSADGRSCAEIMGALDDDLASRAAYSAMQDGVSSGRFTSHMAQEQRLWYGEYLLKVSERQPACRGTDAHRHQLASVQRQRQECQCQARNYTFDPARVEAALLASGGGESAATSTGGFAACQRAAQADPAFEQNMARLQARNPETAVLLRASIEGINLQIQGYQRCAHEPQAQSAIAKLRQQREQVLRTCRQIAAVDNCMVSPFGEASAAGNSMADDEAQAQAERDRAELREALNQLTNAIGQAVNARGGTGPGGPAAGTCGNGRPRPAGGVCTAQ